MKHFSFKARRMAAILSFVLVFTMLATSVFAQDARPTDVTEPGSGNVLIKVELQALSADKQAILDRINEIRREACNQSITITYTDGRRPIQLNPNSYKELKWSTQLEEIALTRAAEANLLLDHQRPNGQQWSSTSYQGITPYSEILAWGQGWYDPDACVMDSIEAWYMEKENVGNPNPTYQGGQTGHYFAMINPNFTHFAVAGVYKQEASYRTCAEGAFLREDYVSVPITENQIKKEGIYSQILEVPATSLNGVRISGVSTLEQDTSAQFSVRANQVQCIDPDLGASQYNNVEIVKDITWGTEKASVATVDSTGKVTARGEGSTNITAQVGTQTYKFPITVPASTTADVFDAKVLSATWTSEDTITVTFDKNVDLALAGVANMQYKESRYDAASGTLTYKTSSLGIDAQVASDGGKTVRIVFSKRGFNNFDRIEEIIFKPNALENANGTTNTQEITQSLTNDRPSVSAITYSTLSIPAEGGTVTATVTGKSLKCYGAIRGELVSHDDSGTETVVEANIQGTYENNELVTFTLDIPENMTSEKKKYTLKLTDRANPNDVFYHKVDADNTIEVDAHTIFRIPEIGSITYDKTKLDENGGTITISVGGINLQYLKRNAFVLENEANPGVPISDSLVPVIINPSTDGNSATITLTFPANQDKTVQRYKVAFDQTLVPLTFENAITHIVVGKEVPVLQYRTGIQGSTSWQTWQQDGQLSGSVGKGLRMEGLQIKLLNKPYEGDIRYSAQIQGVGWQGWKVNGQTAGFNPKKTGGLRLESIKIELTGELAEHYDVWYHMHTQRFGWMGWAKNGEPAGTVGYSFRVEAIEVLILPRGSKPSTPTAIKTPDANMLSYVRTNSYDNKKWQGAKGEGDVSGTRGQKKTAITMGLSQSGIPKEYRGSGVSGITYRVYQNGKWTGWKRNDQEAGNKNGPAIQGLQVKLTGKIASDYDVYYRVEVKNGTKAYWMKWAKNGASAGWKGKNLEQIQVAIVPKGDPAPTADNNAKQRFVLKNFPSNTNLASYGF